MPGQNSALYLYAVVPAKGVDGTPLTIAARGLDGAPVEVISHGEVGILTHACQPAPYEGDAPAVHAWVLSQHEVVAEAFEKAGAALPLRFDSIVATTDRPAAELVRAWLEHSHDDIAARLQRLAGRVELGVQILSALPAATAEKTSAKPAAGSGSRGRNYFQAQMAERKERERIRAAEDALAGHAFAELSSRAEEISLNPKRGGTDSGPETGTRMLLDLAVLVPRDQISRVGDYLGEVAADPAITVRFTGPWPPYSFAGTLEMPAMLTSDPAQTTQKESHGNA
ncbi:MAG: GvpL/GvpF family gas vesicle protein [Candidatus Nanopelagicales bacterium]